jgi:hypothetical protein
MCDLAFVLAWLLVEAAIVVGPYLAGVPNLADTLTRYTVRPALLYYAAAAALMLVLRPAEWPADRGRGWLARWLWTAGWAAYVVHVVVAFALYHHGSHAEAMAHVEAASGWAEGIFVSHLFGLVWTLDVAWWWLRPIGHRRRSPWWDRCLHGFMAFIVFNATVVYETGLIRWCGAALFAGLAAVWLLRKVRFGVNSRKKEKEKELHWE